MEKRKSISKKVRFEVFKRDSFTCQYCSLKPPKVPLEIDHIIPISKGGNNNIDNLITACFDCNRGKSNNELSNLPETILSKTEGKKLAISQYKEYQKILIYEKNQIEKSINMVQNIYSESFNNWEFTKHFRLSVKRFILILGIEVVLEAMEYACSKIYCEQKVLKYFCGICWTKIKEL